VRKRLLTIKFTYLSLHRQQGPSAAAAAVAAAVGAFLHVFFFGSKSRAVLCGFFFQ